MYRFALQMSGEASIAEDVTQDVFLALIKSARRFDPARGTVPSFLFGIARNMLLKRLALRGAEQPPSDESDSAIEEYARDEDPLENLTRRETIDEVRRAVLSLPAAYREAVVLCDLQNLSYEDAAAALECPVGTVRSRLNRARGMLAQKLGQHSFDKSSRAGAI